MSLFRNLICIFPLQPNSFLKEEIIKDEICVAQQESDADEKDVLNNLEEYFVDEEVTEEIIEDVLNFQPQEMSEMEKQLFLSDHFESNLLKQENK